MTTSCVSALVLRLFIILFLVLLISHPSTSRNLKGEEAARKEKMEEARVAQERQSNVNLSKNKIPASGEKELQMSQRQDEQNRANNHNHSPQQETNKGPKREKRVPTHPTKEYLERLCKRKFLFIISSGRSGSTSLHNMVNELPGYSISGEHWGQFLSWHDLYRRFVRTQGRQPYSDYQIGEPRGMARPGDAFEHQPVQDVEFFEMMQDWYYKHTGMRNANSEYSEKSRGGSKPGIELVKGCKEIRYSDANALDFISHAFPCAKFIFNCRKELFREQKHSAFYRKTNNTEEDLRREAKFLMEYHQSDWMKGRSIIMHMEDFSNMTIWNQMAIFLERPHCRFTDVYHDNNGGYNHESKKGPIVQCSQPNSET